MQSALSARNPRLEHTEQSVLKLVLEVAGTSLVRIEHCKSQRLVLSVKGNIDKLESVPVRARGLC